MIYAGYRFWEKEKKKGRGSDLPLGPHSGPTRRPGRKERGLASREIGPGRPGGGGLLAVGLVLLGLGWCWARPSSEEAGRGTRALLAAARGGVDGPRPLSLSPALFGSRCTECTQVVLSPFPPCSLSPTVPRATQRPGGAPAIILLAQHLLLSTLRSAPTPLSSARFARHQLPSPCRLQRLRVLRVVAGAGHAGRAVVPRPRRSHASSLITARARRVLEQGESSRGGLALSSGAQRPERSASHESACPWCSRPRAGRFGHVRRVALSA